MSDSVVPAPGQAAVSCSGLSPAQPGGLSPLCRPQQGGMRSCPLTARLGCSDSRQLWPCEVERHVGTAPREKVITVTPGEQGAWESAL